MRLKDDYRETPDPLSHSHLSIIALLGWQRQRSWLGDPGMCSAPWTDTQSPPLTRLSSVVNLHSAGIFYFILPGRWIATEFYACIDHVWNDKCRMQSKPHKAVSLLWSFSTFWYGKFNAGYWAGSMIYKREHRVHCGKWQGLLASALTT